MVGVGDFALPSSSGCSRAGEALLRPTVAVLPALKLPTAPDPIGTELVDVSLLGLATFAFGQVAQTSTPASRRLAAR